MKLIFLNEILIQFRKWSFPQLRWNFEELRYSILCIIKLRTRFLEINLTFILSLVFISLFCHLWFINFHSIFQTITGAMSTLTPPVSLQNPKDQFRVDYIQDFASQHNFDYPPVSHELFNIKIMLFFSIDLQIEKYVNSVFHFLNTFLSKRERRDFVPFVWYVIEVISG